MSQIFLIIGLLMAVGMLVVGSLLTRRMVTLKGVYIPLVALAYGSFGAFLSGVVGVVNDGRPYGLITLIAGFILAIAAATVFMWQRSRIS